ncbi:MAG: hypothetical protein RMM58_15940 [Chloroflexota bacterium]|nr:hypothetical protein [Chloroflexota bacterium]
MAEPVSRKASRHALAIHGRLDGEQQLRGPLHLVEHDRLRPACDETCRVAARRGEHRQVIERDVSGAELLSHGARELGLSGLPGAVQQHDRPVGERRA